LTALLALARSGEAGVVPEIIDHLVRFSSFDLSVSQLRALVQVAIVCAVQAPDEVMRRKDALVSNLEARFPFPVYDGLHVSPVGTSAAVLRDVARLLAELGSPTIVEKVSRSLLMSPVQEDRLQGLFVLRNVSSGWTKEKRRTYFTVLNEASSFVGGEGMPKFLTQIREQAIATLSEQEREELADVLVPRAAGANDEPLPPARALVKHWTVEDFGSSLRDSPSASDAKRGEIVFRDALCTRCHRAGAQGPAVGPDLTHVAGRFSKRDILESILSPSKVVADNYRNVQIVTTDGRQIVGRVDSEGDFRSEKLRIATEPLRPATIVEISKREIEQAREAETSPMPQGLLDAFTQQDVLDLLAFLTSGAAR
jgi:putative heme-binding domain-containing protein